MSQAPMFPPTRRPGPIVSAPPLPPIFQPPPPAPRPPVARPPQAARPGLGPDGLPPGPSPERRQARIAARLAEKAQNRKPSPPARTVHGNTGPMAPKPKPNPRRAALLEMAEGY